MSNTKERHDLWMYISWAKSVFTFYNVTFTGHMSIMFAMFAMFACGHCKQLCCTKIIFLAVFTVPQICLLSFTHIDSSRSADRCRNVQRKCVSAEARQICMRSLPLRWRPFSRNHVAQRHFITNIFKPIGKEDDKTGEKRMGIWMPNREEPNNLQDQLTNQFCRSILAVMMDIFVNFCKFMCVLYIFNL